MSWHFLQEQAEASWEGSSLDGAPSALLRLMPIADMSFSRDSEMEYPSFAEAMMGWPIGWTELAPLAMDRFQRWLELHGRY